MTGSQTWETNRWTKSMDIRLCALKLPKSLWEHLVASLSVPARCSFLLANTFVAGEFVAKKDPMDFAERAIHSYWYLRTADVTCLCMSSGVPPRKTPASLGLISTWH